ncbi:hypothetical protein [Microbacterium gorillae]|uniref:hypothetical protein n=1 Tax=Microbacterium gorillae TaxID=1231063 RepID=UPI00058D3B0B|nr:hypothetical protein [Microbacterium gorillae]
MDTTTRLPHPSTEAPRIARSPWAVGTLFGAAAAAFIAPAAMRLDGPPATSLLLAAAFAALAMTLSRGVDRRAGRLVTNVAALGLVGVTLALYSVALGLAAFGQLWAVALLAGLAFLIVAGVSAMLFTAPRDGE